MEVDPLADTVPPRYALESDEEEDEYNPLQIKRDAEREPTQFEIKIIGQIAPGRPVIVSSEDAGRIWAKGSDLGEQVGAVAVNGVQIGFIFSPAWTEATIVVSESFSRLPLTSMHPYAQTVLDALKPKNFALLDTYPLPIYPSNRRYSFEDAPLRYLTTSSETTFLEKQGTLQFAPPNLIQSTSASLICLASLTPQISNTLLLLPSPRIPAPQPKQILKNKFPADNDLDEDFEWSIDLLSKAHSLLFEAIGERDVGANHPWKLLGHSGQVSKEKAPKRNVHTGDSGMYI